jgi:nucleoside-diphosphate-sugar epimerase
VQADLLDSEAVSAAVSGCEIIIHLAYGNSGDEGHRRDVTVKGTENVLKAALEHKVRKFIHFSTAAVHGVAPPGPIVYESAPFEKTRDVYRESKIQAEELVWQYQTDYGLTVVVFRPPLIYGPFDYLWAGRIIKEIQSGAILINGGTGSANLVYVDNLVDAVLLALRTETGNGEAFFIVDDDKPSWRQVYECFAGRIKLHPLFQVKSEQEIIELIKRQQSSNGLYNWFIRPALLGKEMVRACLNSREVTSQINLIPWLRFVKERFPHLSNIIRKQKLDQNLANQPAENKIPFNSEDHVRLLASQSRFSNEKIKKILNYQQRISFEEAVDLTFAWAGYQGIIA